MRYSTAIYIMAQLDQFSGGRAAGLNNLLPLERREVLRLVLNRVSIDRNCNVCITLAIPVPELVSNVSQESSSLRHNRHKLLHYGWRVDLAIA